MCFRICRYNRAQIYIFNFEQLRKYIQMDMYACVHFSIIKLNWKPCFPGFWLKVSAKGSLPDIWDRRETLAIFLQRFFLSVCVRSCTVKDDHREAGSRLLWLSFTLPSLFFLTAGLHFPVPPAIVKCQLLK